MLSLEGGPESQAELMLCFPTLLHCFRELEYQLLEQCTVDTGLAKGQSLPSVMGEHCGMGHLCWEKGVSVKW